MRIFHEPLSAARIMVCVYAMFSIGCAPTHQKSAKRLNEENFAEGLADQKSLIHAAREKDQGELKQKSAPKTPINLMLQGEAWIAIGMQFYQTGEYIKAIEVWSKVKESELAYAEAQNHIAMAYLRMRKIGRAKVASDIAVRREPANKSYKVTKMKIEREARR